MRVAFKVLLGGVVFFVFTTKTMAQSDSLFSTLPVTTVSATPLRSGMTGELQTDISTVLQALPTALNFAELLPAVGGVFSKKLWPRHPRYAFHPGRFGSTNGYILERRTPAKSNGRTERCFPDSCSMDR